MVRYKFIRLSGWGMVFAGISLLLSWLPEGIPDDLYQYFGEPVTLFLSGLVQSIVEGVRSMALPAAILLITFGLVGLYLRYGKQAGLTAKIALGVGILGGVASLVSFVLMRLGLLNGRPTVNISLAFAFAGLLIFGLVALRVKPMPRGNGLPFLAGLWWPALVIQAYGFPQVTRSLGPEFPAWLSFATFSFMSFFLAWLGYLLQADVPKERSDDHTSAVAAQAF